MKKLVEILEDALASGAPLAVTVADNPAPFRLRIKSVGDEGFVGALLSDGECARLADIRFSQVEAVASLDGADVKFTKATANAVREGK